MSKPFLLFVLFLFHAPRLYAEPPTCTVALMELHRQKVLPERCGPLPVLLRVVHNDTTQPQINSYVGILRTANGVQYMNKFWKALQNSVAYAQRYAIGLEGQLLMSLATTTFHATVFVWHPVCRALPL